MLLRKKESQEHFKKLLRNGYCKDYLNFICTDDFGMLIKPEYVTTHFKYVISKNELRHLKFHDLRHTCASLLLANHIPLKSIQDWLGHANFEITIPVPNSNTKTVAVPTDMIIVNTLKSSVNY